MTDFTFADGPEQFLPPKDHRHIPLARTDGQFIFAHETMISKDGQRTGQTDRRDRADAVPRRLLDLGLVCHGEPGLPKMCAQGRP